MRDVMIDLETMGTGPDAAIVAIGAIAFDPDTGALGEDLYCVVELESSVQCGGVIDPGTVMWWLGQSAEARAELRNKDGLDMPTALASVERWLRAQCEWSKLRVWGNGAAFDNVILAGAFRRASLAQPWAHWNERCYRTLKALHPDVPFERQGTHHNALHDARSQAVHAVAIFRAMRGNAGLVAGEETDEHL